MSEGVVDGGDQRHINHNGKTDLSASSGTSSTSNGEEVNVSITQKMLSAVSGSILTSLLGT